jgi:hypothetical protein
MQANRQLLRSVELASRAGVSTDTLRYYEQKDVLPPPTQRHDFLTMLSSDLLKQNETAILINDASGPFAWALDRARQALRPALWVIELPIKFIHMFPCDQRLAARVADCLSLLRPRLVARVAQIVLFLLLSGSNLC